MAVVAAAAALLLFTNYSVIIIIITRLSLSLCISFSFFCEEIIIESNATLHSLGFICCFVWFLFMPLPSLSIFLMYVCVSSSCIYFFMYTYLYSYSDISCFYIMYFVYLLRFRHHVIATIIVRIVMNKLCVHGRVCAVCFEICAHLCVSSLFVYC